MAEIVRLLYPEVQPDDFEFLERFRNWLKKPHSDFEIRNHLKSAIRTEKTTHGLKSLILGNYSIGKILMYPYKDYPPRKNIIIDFDTLKTLNQLIKSIEWTFQIDKNGLRLGARNDCQKQLYEACMHDENTRELLNGYGLQISIMQTRALCITLCSMSDLEKLETPISLNNTRVISATGVSIGFNFECVKFSWFLCIDVLVDSSDRDKFQKNLHLIVAAKLR